LLADKAGEGADYLKNRAQQGSEYVKQRADDLRQQASDIVDKGRQTVAQQKDNLSAAVEAGKQAYRDAVSDVKSASSGVGTGSSGASFDRS
jgi:gas vesicle protein